MNKRKCWYCGKNFDRKYKHKYRLFKNDQYWHTECFNSFCQVRTYLSSPKPSNHYVYSQKMEQKLINAITKE